MRRGWAAAIASFALIAVGVTVSLIVYSGSDATPTVKAAAVSVCDRYAALAGSDRAPGTRQRPLRTVRALLRRLDPGDTGCLRGGVYEEDVTIRRGGTHDRPITLMAAPGSRATLRGRLVIADSANDLVFRNLVLDGRNDNDLPSPTVNGDRIQFLGNDVTNFHTSICFILGSHEYGIAVDTLIEGNRIHDCGHLPATNHDHGIYLSASRDAVIRDNVIYGNADRGVQLYPDAQNTLVEWNIIDGNGQGVIFSGDDDDASSENIVRNNIISNSTIRFNVESFWEGPVGMGNLLTQNCVWGGAKGDIDDEEGFTAVDNVVADPLFVDRAAGDYRLRPDSPCLRSSPPASVTRPR